MQKKVLQYNTFPDNDPIHFLRGKQVVRPQRCRLGEGLFPTLETGLEYYAEHLAQFPRAGIIIEYKFFKRLKIFDNEINLDNYFFDRTGQAHCFFIKITKELNNLFLEYYYDQDCQKKMINGQTGCNKKDILLKLGERIVPHVYNKQNGCSALFNKYAEYYHTHPAEIPAEGLLLPLELRSKVIKILNKQINFKTYLFDQNDKEVLFFTKIFYESGQVIFRFYADPEGHDQLKGPYKIFCTLYLLREQERLVLHWENKALEKIINYYFLNQKLITKKGIDLPGFYEGIYLFKRQRQFVGYFPKTDLSSHKVFPRLVLENGLCLLKFYYDQERSKPLQKHKKNLTYVLYQENKKVIFESYGRFVIKKYVDFVKTILAPDFHGELKFPYLINRNYLVYKKNLRQTYAEDIEKDEYGFFIIARKNIYQQTEIHYYADRAYAKHLKNIWHEKVDIITKTEQGYELYPFNYNKEIKDFILNAIKNDFTEPLYCPVPFFIGQPKIFKDRTCFTEYFPKRADQNEIRVFLKIIKNSENQKEVHYYYDPGYSQPLITRSGRTRIDILFYEPIIKFVFKRSRKKETELEKLLRTGKESYRSYSISLDATIYRDSRMTKHEVIGTENYAPEVLLFPKQDDQEYKVFRKKILNSFLQASYKYKEIFFPEEIKEVILPKYFEMNYLEKDKQGYNDQLIAAELKIPLENVMQYQAQCEKILYSPEFAQAVEAAGLLDHTLGAYYDIPE